LGISCSPSLPQHVIELVLNSNNLSGTLPVTLARLDNMENFSLISNNIGGELPDALHTWTNIKSFRMERNNLQ
jgi:hypothetical protein